MDIPATSIRSESTTTTQCFEDDNDNGSSLSGASKSIELVAPFDDDTTRKSDLAPSDFLAFVGVFFFFPFVALAACQDIENHYGVQMVFFYLLNACVPVLYWVHFYVCRIPIALVHILLWTTASCSVVYLVVGPLYFRDQTIVFGVVMGLVSSLWHAWLVVSVQRNKKNNEITNNNNNNNDDDGDVMKSIEH